MMAALLHFLWLVVWFGLLGVPPVLSWEEVDYSYDPDSDVGPDEWSNINVQDTDNECAGNNQSPIDIPTDVTCDTRVNYRFSSGSCTDLTFSVSNVAMRADYPDDGSCELNAMEMPDGTSVQATHFHIHVGSEHTLSGEKLDGELHIFHGNSVRCVDGNNFHVLGVMLQASSMKNNKDFDIILQRLSNIAQETLSNCGIEQNAQGNENRMLEGSSNLDLYKLLPSRSAVYQYSGSLTVPPCTEPVEWHLLEDPIMISTSQLQQLRALNLGYYDADTCELATSSYNGYTNRTTMPLNDRTVLRQCPSQSKVAFAGVLLVGTLVAILIMGTVFTLMNRIRPAFGNDKLMDVDDELNGQDSKSSRQSSSNQVI